MTELKQFIDAHFIGEVVSEVCLEDDFYVFSIQIKDSQSNIRILYPKEQMIPLSKGDLIDGKGKLFYVEEEGNAFYCPADYIVRICCCESKSEQNSHEIEKENKEVLEQNEVSIPSQDSTKSESVEIPNVPTILKLSPPPSLISIQSNHKEEIKENPHEIRDAIFTPMPQTDSTQTVEQSVPEVEKSDSQQEEPSSVENKVTEPVVIGRFTTGDFDC